VKKNHINFKNTCDITEVTLQANGEVSLQTLLWVSKAISYPWSPASETEHCVSALLREAPQSYSTKRQSITSLHSWAKLHIVAAEKNRCLSKFYLPHHIYCAQGKMPLCYSFHQLKDKFDQW